MNFKELTKAIFKGKIFIYPTDTVYGLGCNAEDKNSVEKIKEIKGRDKDKPLSVIAPNVAWIYEHLNMNEILEKYLPGPYTLILEKHNSGFLSWVAPGSTLGVRIPDAEFCREIQKTGVPFITTSVNLSGQKPGVKINEIDKEIINKVDVVVQAEDETKLSGKPSSLVIRGELVERS